MTREEAIEVYNGLINTKIKEAFEFFAPELCESEDERIRKESVEKISNLACGCFISQEQKQNFIAYLEKQKEPEDKGEISDGYHTFNELYYYRMLYNAAFFNLLPKEWVHKSKRHHDGEECFGGGWFIVMANLPTGQVSNHYELKDWDLFQIPEKEIADEWDGHTPQEAAERIHKYLLEKQKERKPAEWDEEDEHRRKDAIYFLESAKKHYADTSEIEKTIDWLKSIRPQPQGTYKQVIHTIFGMLKDKDFYEIQPSHRVSLLNDIRVKCKDAIECAPILDEPSWKPSEEQMKALKRASTNEYLSAKQFDILVSLYEQLKAL